MTQFSVENGVFHYHTESEDSDFVEDVAADIRDFLKNQCGKRVLVFPPFNNFRRCLIHQLVEHSFENLKSFSIGEGDGRRTVVCFNKDFKSQCNVQQSAGSSQLDRPPPKLSNRSSEVSPESACCDSNNSGSRRAKRVRTMPSVSIYRPPAARRLEQNANLAALHGHHHHEVHHSREEVVGGPGSPDKNNLKCSEEGKDVGNGTPTGRRNYENGMSVFRNAISSIRTQNKAPVACKNGESGNSVNKKDESVLPAWTKIEESGKNKPRRPDIQVYVPKGRRSVPAAVSNNSFCNSNSGVSSINTSDENKNDVVASVKQAKKDEEDEGKVKEEEEKFVDKKQETGKDVVKIVSEVVEKEVVKVTRDKSPEVKESVLSNATKSPEVPEAVESSNSHVNVSSQGSGESDKRKTNGTVENGKKVDEEKEKKSEKGEAVKTEGGNGNRKPKEVHLNPEEDDWESMFDDTGECLDPSLLEQLTSAVGDVSIETPKSGYNDFKTKSLDVMADEFPHVIEIYNFPPEFQLQDLMTVFSQFKNSGFEIKWVDDTHALGIFSSSAVVSEVLSFYHPFVKTRSLKEGTPLSKMKARRSAEFLLPYKPRPDTCPALARRLVTGALGVKLKTSREEREAEKKILTKAREKKKLEAKQKEDAWEGTFS